METIDGVRSIYINGEEHSYRDVKVRKISNSGDFSCQFCSRLFKNKLNLELHVARHADDRQVECDICDQKFVSELMRDKHMNVHYRTYRCRLCPMEFASVKARNEHKSAEHGPQRRSTPSKSPRFSNVSLHCDICERKCKNFRQLKEHRLIHNPAIQPTAVSTKEPKADSEASNATTDSLYPCDMCSKTFSVQFDVVIHRRVEHNSEKLHKDTSCQICDKQLSSMNLFMEHLQVHELKTFPPSTICTTCGQVFPTINLKLQHQKQEHPATPLNATESVAEEAAEVKEYMCVICDQTFSTEGDMFAHRVKDHPSHFDESFRCPICGQCMGSFEQLSWHKYTHTRGPASQPMPYPCDLCPAFFGQVKQLVDHKAEKHPDKFKKRDYKQLAEKATEKENERRQKAEQNMLKMELLENKILPEHLKEVVILEGSDYLDATCDAQIFTHSQAINFMPVHTHLQCHQQHHQHEKRHQHLHRELQQRQVEYTGGYRIGGSLELLPLSRTAGTQLTQSTDAADITSVGGVAAECVEVEAPSTEGAAAECMAVEVPSSTAAMSAQCVEVEVLEEVPVHHHPHRAHTSLQAVQVLSSSTTESTSAPTHTTQQILYVQQQQVPAAAVVVGDESGAVVEQLQLVDDPQQQLYQQQLVTAEAYHHPESVATADDMQEGVAVLPQPMEVDGDTAYVIPSEQEQHVLVQNTVGQSTGVEYHYAVDQQPQVTATTTLGSPKKQMIRPGMVIKSGSRVFTVVALPNTQTVDDNSAPAESALLEQQNTTQPEAKIAHPTEAGEVPMITTSKATTTTATVEQRIESINSINSANHSVATVDDDNNDDDDGIKIIESKKDTKDTSSEELMKVDLNNIDEAINYLQRLKQQNERSAKT